jgi:4-hydroxy-2-oxoheptanedioate aldolase
LAETADAAAKAGKAAGILMYDPNDFQKYNRMGFRFIACGADMTFVVNGANAMAEKLKNLAVQAKTSDSC